MTTYYVEAYDSEGRQILGNGQGQNVYKDVKNPRRCRWFNSLFIARYPHVARYDIKTADGKLFESIKPMGVTFHEQ